MFGVGARVKAPFPGARRRTDSRTELRPMSSNQRSSRPKAVRSTKIASRELPPPGGSAGGGGGGGDVVRVAWL